MRTRQAGWVVGGAVMVSLMAGRLSAQDDSWTWSERMNAGDELAIRNVTGRVHVVRASGASAEVRARKTGSRGDFDRVSVRVERDSHGYTICAVYDPRDDDGCQSRGIGRRDRIRAAVDFEVSVPPGVDLDVASVTGDVDVRDVQSDVSVRTVSGDIDVATSEGARASTVSGTMQVDVGSSGWKDLAFHSVSGDITLGLPAGIGTSVDFASLSGDLDSDFDIAGRDRGHRWVGSRVRGDIGDGSRALEVNTVSGDVRLRRNGS